MSAINYQELRELATGLQKAATHQELLAFRAMLSPSAVLALLDELEHARTMSPAIRLALHHEIADFCATLGGTRRTRNAGSDAARAAATHRRRFRFLS